ncbi:hypothetical protein JW964_03405, partial [candidate division KSB1 bacterium]|nr:hypothetical protein [candidate division KSB1 bacterium]
MGAKKYCLLFGVLSLLVINNALFATYESNDWWVSGSSGHSVLKSGRVQITAMVYNYGNGNDLNRGKLYYMDSNYKYQWIASFGQDVNKDGSWYWDDHEINKSSKISYIKKYRGKDENGKGDFLFIVLEFTPPSDLHGKSITFKLIADWEGGDNTLTESGQSYKPSKPTNLSATQDE